METLSLILAISIFIGIALFTIFFLEIVSFISIFVGLFVFVYLTIDAIYCVILEKFEEKNRK